MFIRTLIAGVALCMGPAVFANGSEEGEGGQDQVTLEILKQKCAELTANDQLKPIKATVTCNELTYVWQAEATSPAQLQNSRNVGAHVTMKTFQVAHKFFPAEQAPTDIQCQNFVKVERKVDNVDVEMLCGDLEAIQDLGAFCQPVIEQRVAADPALRTERRTSETISVCPNSGSIRRN